MWKSTIESLVGGCNGKYEQRRVGTSTSCDYCADLGWIVKRIFLGPGRLKTPWETIFMLINLKPVELV